MADLFRRMPLALAAVAILVSPLFADQKKLTDDEHMEIIRGLSAEYATVKVPLPCSRKPLDIQTDGSYDRLKWDDAGKKFGQAGKVGDLVQVTRVSIEKDAIVLEINGGMKSKGSWKDHISIGMGGGVAPINRGPQQAPPSGTTIALRFDEPVGSITSTDIKKMLAPVIDFDKDTVTKQYVDTLTPEVKKAVEEKRAIEGMTRDQVLLALGHPVRKVRETRDGTEYEDWIYGTPPGRVTFVTFADTKVVQVKETYAGLGGSIAQTPDQP